MKKYFLLFNFIIASLFTFGQIQKNPVEWKATYSPLPNLEGEIIITANIGNKWHIYSQRPTDAGPIPTSFTITTTAKSNIQFIGKVTEENAHEEFVKAFDAKVFVFEKEAIFKQKLKGGSKNETVVKITLEYMTCNDMQCLPPKIVELEVIIPATTTTVLKK